MRQLFLLSMIGLVGISANFQQKIAVPEIGVVQDFQNDSLLQAFGYRYLVESTAKLFSPVNVSDQQFQQHLQKINSLRIPLFATNLFIPGHLKVVGPEVDERSVLSYVETVFQRGQAAGIKMIIWGSGGSRQVPDGFDRTTAKKQFIAMARKIAALAKQYNITLAFESLNSTEANFVNTVAEALEIVKSVDHENFRLCADIYHMLMEGESPAVIEKTKNYLVYCEIAEKKGRTPPGVHGENFKPYFATLKKIGYEGKVVLECRWENLEKQGAIAYQTLREQIDEVYKD